MIFMEKNNGKWFKILSLCLALTLALSANVFASDETITPYASQYISSYDSSINDLGNGTIQIWFEVQATEKMDEVGVTRILLYEVTSDGSLKSVKTFQSDDYSSMVKTNSSYIYSYVTYYGPSSKTYKAHVSFWAGKNGDGDARYMWVTE